MAEKCAGAVLAQQLHWSTWLWLCQVSKHVQLKQDLGIALMFKRQHCAYLTCHEAISIPLLSRIEQKICKYDLSLHGRRRSF